MAEQSINVWDFALATRKERLMSSEKSKTLLFVGNKKSGKSALILRMTDIETNHSAVALDYTFARAKGSKNSRDICDIWELGGGTLFCNLLDYVITTDTLPYLGIFLVVDLSQAEEMIAVVDTMIESIRERIETLVSRDSSYIVKESMRQKARQRFGESHEDASDINPFLVPLVIVGTKYDVFQGIDPEKRKSISRYLRLASHTRGAMLCYTTTKSEVTMNRIRSIVSHIAFGTPDAGKTIIDPNKALLIPFGSDSFQLIGQVSLESARSHVIEMFPNQVVSNFVIPDNPAKDPKFAERDIDLVRGVRDKELEDYRRQLELKYDEMGDLRGVDQ